MNTAFFGLFGQVPGTGTGPDIVIIDPINGLGVGLFG
jgi:hypothetical protein